MFLQNGSTAKLLIVHLYLTGSDPVPFVQLCKKCKKTDEHKALNKDVLGRRSSEELMQHFEPENNPQKANGSYSTLKR